MCYYFYEWQLGFKVLQKHQWNQKNDATEDSVDVIHCCCFHTVL